MTQLQMEPKKLEEKPQNNGGQLLRRNNRGCKSKEFYDWPEQSFDDMDSPLAVQQYIQQLIRRNPADIDEILRLPEGQDLGAWKIEHLRLFCMQLNGLATRLQDCCFPETCNQMTATEQWIFLCAAHKQPNECPAIDYTRHTLDGAASLLNSNKYFPSRVTIKESSVAKLGSVCRRVYRIFSHAYYHHFQVFDEFERATHLCKRFSKFVTIYELMSKDSLIVPSDGSKPEQLSESLTASATTSTTTTATTNNTTSTTADANTTIAAASTDLSNDIIKKEAEESECEPSKPTLEAPSNNESSNKNKKSTTDKLGSSSRRDIADSDWTPSASSTNTIVKGFTRAGNIEDTGLKSSLGGENIPKPPTETKSPNIGTTKNNPKNGVESEA